MNPATVEVVKNINTVTSQQKTQIITSMQLLVL